MPPHSKSGDHLMDRVKRLERRLDQLEQADNPFMGDSVRVANSKTPSSASDTGTAGMIAWDASYIYVCTATNTWKRVAIATW